MMSLPMHLLASWHITGIRWCMYICFYKFSKILQLELSPWGCQTRLTLHIWHLPCFQQCFFHLGKLGVHCLYIYIITSNLHVIKHELGGEKSFWSTSGSVIVCTTYIPSKIYYILHLSYSHIKIASYIFFHVCSWLITLPLQMNNFSGDHEGHQRLLFMNSIFWVLCCPVLKDIMIWLVWYHTQKNRMLSGMYTMW